MTRKAISLFSSAGIGELGISGSNIQVVVANELLEDRCDLYQENYPDTTLIRGDIWENVDKIILETKKRLAGDELFLAYATPPCQGMSTNGIGKLKAEVRAGNRHHEDPRNRLIIPAMSVICELRPRWVLFENVPNMQNTVIRTDSGEKNIIEFVRESLGSEYVGREEVISCADYGIPQIRKRLITIFTRSVRGKEYFISNGGTFFPVAERKVEVTLRQAIGGLPELDAIPGKNSRKDYHPYHFVAVMDPEKYWWISNTPEGETAYNNQCVNKACGYLGNRRHDDTTPLEKKEGAAKYDTPIYCEKCGNLLPRPTIVDKKTGERRVISGFHSAYRRMKWDEPSRTITINVFFEASDNKVHPSQNRVLSILEALIIQTVDRYPYRLEVKGKPIGKGLISQILGESVPPYLIEQICEKMEKIEDGGLALSQGLLFYRQ